MRHGVIRRGPVPVLLTRRKPHDITGTDFFDRTAPALDAPNPESDNQRLTEGVGVPGRASARFEGHARTLRPFRRMRVEKRINPNGAGEPVGRPFPEGRDPARLISIFFSFRAALCGAPTVR